MKSEKKYSIKAKRKPLIGYLQNTLLIRWPGSIFTEELWVKGNYVSVEKKEGKKEGRTE